MKTERNPNEIAGLAEAVDAELDWVARSIRSTQLSGGARALTEGDSFVSRMRMAEWMPAFGLDNFIARGAEGLGESPAPVTASPHPSAEALRSEVLRHVAELRLTGARGLDVVLQPDAGTQLTLRLTRGAEGEVTLRASCAQGDATLLAAHWGEVRQSLAQQGVRVEPLEFASRGGSTFEPQTGNGGPSPDGQSSSQRHGQPWPETLDDLPLVGSITESPARRGVQRQPGGRTRLLESWA